MQVLYEDDKVSKSTRWCFTWFNQEGKAQEFADLLANLVEAGTLSYAIFQEEICPDTSNHHFQGFVIISGQRQRFSALKKILDPVRKAKSGIHLAACNGSPEQNRAYCSKEESRMPGTEFHEFGTCPGAKKEKVDWSAITALLESDHDLAEIIRTIPEICVKHFTNIQKMYDILQMASQRKATLEYYMNMELRPWQHQMWLNINSCPKGKIIWVYDERGLNGKSELIKWMATIHGACFLTSARTADIAHAWKLEPIVLVDCSRTSADHFNYDAVERLSSGLIFSPKFNSGGKILPQVTVAVFSNAPPDWSAVSVGRWEAYALNNLELSPLEDPRIKQVRFAGNV